MMLTVFTPTYNRATLLPRLYESLLLQTNQDFEWLIVDDGSTDETERVVEQLRDEQRIQIRYIKKENGGKHTAHNEAVKHASGKWFMCVDSDDILSPHAVSAISEAEKHLLKADCGFLAYKIRLGGELLCDTFSQTGNIHYSIYQYSNVLSTGGEYVIVLFTLLAEKFPYPVIENERFIGECVLYDRLDLDGYTICPLPEVLEECEYQPDGLTSRFYQMMLRNPGGYQIYHAQRIDLAISFRERLRHCISYQAFRRMSGRRVDGYRGRHRILAACAWLPGQLGAIYYQYKGKTNA